MEIAIRVRRFQPKMRRRIALLGAIISLAACKTPGAGSRLRSENADVVDVTDVDAAARSGIKKALRYLDSTQIKTADSLDDHVRLSGEWPSYVRGSVASDSNLHALYDSNAFVPMFVTYPFFLLDDSALPVSARRLSAMKGRTLALLKKWYVKANGEVNFWPTINGFHGPHQIVEALPFARLLGPVFDIANDADDTAVYYVTSLKAGGGTPKDFPNTFSGWVDTNRVRTDEREAKWKAPETGAFMTWLTNEDKAGNKQPIPFKLANNVDCLVIGNVLYSVGLNRKVNGGAASPPGYDASCALARDVIEKKSYPGCALYYPPQWLFPYAVSRAFRDGDNACLAPAMPKLAQTIIAAQAEDGSWNDQGEFANLPEDVNSQEREFRGDSRIYSTALNVVNLSNIGKAAGMSKTTVDDAIQRGVKFLLTNVTKEDGKEFWQGGVFFSSSYQTVARWKSRAYTTAVVLEALVKFVKKYGEQDDAPWPLAEGDVPAEWLSGGDAAPGTEGVNQ